MHTTQLIPDDVLHLAGLLEPSWPARQALLRLGGDPLNDGEGAGGEGGSGEGAGGEGGEGAGAGEGAGGEGGGSGEGEGGEQWTPPSRAQWEKAQREAREAREKLKAAEQKEAERKRKAAEEAGNHQQLAQQERERAEAAERKAAELEQKATDTERDNRITRIAGRLKFRDAGDAIPTIRKKLEGEALDDDSKVERALKDLAKEKPYLVDGGEQPRTRDLGGGDGGKGGADVEVSGQSRLERAYAQSGAGKAK